MKTFTALILTLALGSTLILGCGPTQPHSTIQSEGESSSQQSVMSFLMLMLIGSSKIGPATATMIWANSFTSLPVGQLFNSGRGLQVSLFEEDIKKIAKEVRLEINEQHLLENQRSMRAVFDMTTAYFTDKDRGYLPSLDSKLIRLGDITNRTIEVINQLEAHGLAGAKNRLLGQSLLIRIDHEESTISGRKRQTSGPTAVEQAHEMIERDRQELQDLVDKLVNQDLPRDPSTMGIYEVHSTSQSDQHIRKRRHHYKLCFKLGESEEVCTKEVTCIARNEINAFCKSSSQTALKEFRNVFRQAATEHFEYVIWENVETVYQALDKAEKVVEGTEDIDITLEDPTDTEATETVDQEINEAEIAIPAESATLSIEDISKGAATLVISFPRTLPVGYEFGIQMASEFTAELISPLDVGFNPGARSFELLFPTKKFVVSIKSSEIEGTLNSTELINSLDLQVL